jgi:hypothetical protein
MADEEVQTITEEAADVQWYTDTEMITAACYALDAAEAANPLTKSEKARADRIKRRALMILDKSIGELYRTCFPPTPEETNLEDQE